jgi:hypothetical protein
MKTTPAVPMNETSNPALRTPPAQCPRHASKTCWTDCECGSNMESVVCERPVWFSRKPRRCEMNARLSIQTRESPVRIEGKESDDDAIPKSNGSRPNAGDETGELRPSR